MNLPWNGDLYENREMRADPSMDVRAGAVKTGMLLFSGFRRNPPEAESQKKN